MSDAKHTPTPWIAVQSAAHGIHCNIAGTGGRIGGTTEAGLIAHVKCIPAAWGDAQANADFILRACNSHDALVAALEKMTPPMPPKNAMCHVGICEQEECGNCSRIARAHAALKLARGEV